MWQRCVVLQSTIKFVSLHLFFETPLNVSLDLNGLKNLVKQNC